MAPLCEFSSDFETFPPPRLGLDRDLRGQCPLRWPFLRRNPRLRLRFYPPRGLLPPVSAHTRFLMFRDWKKSVTELHIYLKSELERWNQ